MLAGVLQRLQAAKVDRSLDLRGVPADAVASNLCRKAGPATGGRQRFGEALVGEERRVDPVGEVAELLQGVLEVAPQLLHESPGLVRVPLGELAGQADLDCQRHEVLLRPVVQIPLDPPTLGVPRGHDAAS